MIAEEVLKTVIIWSCYLIEKGNFQGVLKNYLEPGPGKFAISSTTLVADQYLEDP